MLMPAMKRRFGRQRPSKYILITSICSVFILAAFVFTFPIVDQKSYAANNSAISPQSLGEDAIVSCTFPHVITHGPRNKKEVALTFDADMTYWMKQNLLDGHVKSYINRELISYLENTNTKATLFLTGLWIELYPNETKALAKNPLFELANHSYSHPSFEGYCYGLPQLGPLSMEEEIDKTQSLLQSVAGVNNKYFRFPGGCVSQAAMDYLASKGMQVIHWDVVGDDGFNNDTQGIIKNVLEHVHNGSIIVMHMNGAPNDPKTTEAIPVIITNLKAKGYEFVKVEDLLQ